VPKSIEMPCERWFWVKLAVDESIKGPDGYQGSHAHACMRGIDNATKDFLRYRQLIKRIYRCARTVHNIVWNVVL